VPVRRHPLAPVTLNDPCAEVPLDRALIARLTATYEVARARDLRLAEIFYAKLFAIAPQLQPLFHEEPHAQAAKLMATLDVIVRNLERPAQSALVLERLGTRHRLYGARPEHYDLVIDLLIDAMRDVIGSESVPGAGDTEDNLQEWRVALRYAGDRMIESSEAPGRPGADPGSSA